MPRKLKYGLETKMKRVPIELDDVINSICLKYGSLDEIEQKMFIERLNEETRKDFEQKVCLKSEKCNFKKNGKCYLNDYCEYQQ